MSKASRRISDREKCVFECGIKLATAYHQFVGTPVSARSRRSLEKAIAQALENQPYVENAQVKIRMRNTGKSRYVPLNGDMMDVAVVVRYGTARCAGRMKYIKGYPLMFIEKIEEF